MALPRDVVVLSAEQFDKLVELLTPGYECAKMMLADRQSYNTPDIHPDADSMPQGETGGEGQPAAADSAGEQT